MTREGSAAAVQRPIPAQFLPGSSAMMRCDALVLDAKLRQSLVTVRSLGRRGLSVAALETFKDIPTFSSRWCQQAFCAPSYEQDTEPYLAYLEQLLNRTDIEVLIVSSDDIVALIRQHRERLEQR